MLFDHPIEGTSFSISILSVGLILFLGYVNLKGMKGTSSFNNIVQVVNIAIIFFFIFIGTYYIYASNENENLNETRD